MKVTLSIADAADTETVTITSAGEGSFSYDELGLTEAKGNELILALERALENVFSKFDLAPKKKVITITANRAINRIN